MIKVENLQFKYDQKEKLVIKDVSLQINQGEYVAIIGPNGCGKSTLIKHFNALLLPAKGNVWIDEMNTRDSSVIEEIRQRVGMIFQNPDNQIVAMTVEEDVAFGPGNLKLPSDEIRNRVQKSLEAVGMVKEAKRSPHNLSGGEKRLVSIAGLLAMDPRYIAFDEPTSSLDPHGKKSVLGIIKELNKKGVTIIHITHDMNEIVHADRVIVMNKGEIVLNGSPSEIFSRIDVLKNLGLNVPTVTELVYRLRDTFKELDSNIYTIDDAYLKLSSFIKKFKDQI